MAGVRDSGFVAVGRIVKPHGIHGEAAVFPLSDEEARFAPGARVFLSPTPEGERETTPVTIEASRLHKGRRLVRLERFEDRTRVEQRVGWYLVIPREEADAALGEDEVYLHALPGREVRTPDGRRIGRVVDVLETEGTPLLEIEAPGGRRLLPFVRAFVREVGEEAIVAEPPAGWDEI